jgi:hypothetical protein
MQGGFWGDADYGATLSQYEATLSAPPPFDVTPDLVGDNIGSMVEG